VNNDCHSRITGTHSPLGYALLFPGVEGKTVRLLRERGGLE
jgi:hypothetical protein